MPKRWSDSPYLKGLTIRMLDPLSNFQNYTICNLKRRFSYVVYIILRYYFLKHLDAPAKIPGNNYLASKVPDFFLFFCLKPVVTDTPFSPPLFTKFKDLFITYE